jgi:hypothetical protein
MTGDLQIILKITHNAYVMELSVTKVLPKWYQSHTKPFNVVVQSVSWFLLQKCSYDYRGQKVTLNTVGTPLRFLRLQVFVAVRLLVSFFFWDAFFVSHGYRIPTFRSNVVTSPSRAEMFVLG